MDANNVISDTFSLVISPQREILNAIFLGEKLWNWNNLVNAVANITINEVGYELNTATASDAQVEFASNLDKSTHTRNVITHQTLLSIQTIRIRHEEISVLLPLMNPSIAAITMAPQTLKLPVVQ